MPHILEDLQEQTFNAFEAILVNDGDNSQTEAMEAIAAQDNRIRIVHRQENGGVAAARNSGTDNVTSLWVVYPDPDDRFGPNYVKSLYEAVDGTGVEMACGGYRLFEAETKEEKIINIDAKLPVECVDIILGYERMYSSNTQHFAWNKLYNIELIHKYGLRQNTDFYNRQDQRFNLSYFPFVKRVGLVNNCDYVYHYYKNGLSNSTKYNPRFMTNMQEIINLRFQLRRQFGWSEQRVEDTKRDELILAIRNMFMNLYFSNSRLTIGEATAKLQADLFDQPEIVAVIKKANIKRNRTLHLIKILTYIGSARFTAVIFNLISILKKCLDNLQKNTFVIKKIIHLRNEKI